MSELGPVSQAILDYIDMRKGYIAIFEMVHRVSLKTGTSHTTPWYFRRLVSLALEGRIEGKIFRTGDDMEIKFIRLQEVEVVNSVVEIEQVQNGYIVTLPYQKDETFFDDFSAVVSYLKFCFNLEEGGIEAATELYWCEKCGRNHKYTSKIGRDHRSDSYIILDPEGEG